MPADVLVGRRLTVDALRSAFDAAMADEGLGDIQVAQLRHEVHR